MNTILLAGIVRPLPSVALVAVSFLSPLILVGFLTGFTVTVALPTLLVFVTYEIYSSCALSIVVGAAGV